MSEYEDAVIVREYRRDQEDGSELRVRMLQGVASAEGHHCLHRIISERNGQLKSDIVYYYAPQVTATVVSADFDLLTSARLMSVNQLHHNESMLNRRMRTARYAVG
jgi:hypothetical protein